LIIIFFLYKVPISEFEKWPKDKQDKFMELAYQIDDYTLSGFPEGLAVPEDVLIEVMQQFDFITRSQIHRSEITELRESLLRRQPLVRD